MEPETQQEQQDQKIQNVGSVVLILLVAGFFTIMGMWWLDGVLTRRADRRTLDGIARGSGMHFSNDDVSSTWRRFYLVCDDSGIIVAEMEQMHQGSWKGNLRDSRLEHEYIDVPSAGEALVQGAVVTSMCSVIRP